MKFIGKHKSRRVLVNMYKSADNVYCIECKDKLMLGMLFCKLQEIYESPINSIRNNYHVTFQDVITEYCKCYNTNTFSYCDDWSGYNIPKSVMEKYYTTLNQRETYDMELGEIAFTLWRDNGFKWYYLIGVTDVGKSDYIHELAHALYGTNKSYKTAMNKAISKLSARRVKALEKELTEMGYHSSVMKDEIQAYLVEENKFGFEKIFSKFAKINNTP